MDLLPRISSDNVISERVGYTNIEIKYGSPKVRGRVIWGNLEEYDQIWRAGANRATTISFSEDVRIHDQLLEKGIYAFFVIPRENDQWTVIFNKEHDQWGAFNYNQDLDAIRIDVPKETVHHTEDLTYDIVGEGFEKAHISLLWEKIKLHIVIDVQYLDILESNLYSKLENLEDHIKWVFYLQAAEFLIDENKAIDKAGQWLHKSLELYEENNGWSGQFYPKPYVYGHLNWTLSR